MMTAATMPRSRPARTGPDRKSPRRRPAPESPPAPRPRSPELGPARRELLALQMRLWRRLQREVDQSIEEVPPNITIYQEEYERDVQRFEAVSSKAELVEAAAGADVVYVGDYHTLPQAQQTLVKLLLAVTRARKHVVLAVELVHADMQRALDRYMAGKSTEERFLRDVAYERTWGFPWPPYREVLEVARARGVRVVAMNSNPEGHDADHLLERDFRAAEVIVRELVGRPDALVIVFDGDLHVARDHLPLIVDNLLSRRGARPRKKLVVHQNAENVHWALARRGQEHAVNVVRLARDAYCVLNASPLEKLHSYLNWVAARETLVPPEASSWEMDAFGGLDADEFDDDHDPTPDYTEQVLQVIQAVARFLGVDDRDDLDAFSLFTVNDLDFLDHLQSSDRYSELELADIKRQILSNESYFIPKGDVIYLSDFSVVNAAEEGAHFLHHRCSGYRWSRPRDLVTDFYFRCVTEALGYFGSKLLVPTRPCWTDRDCERLIEATRRRRRRAARKAEQSPAAAAAAGPHAPAAGDGPTLQHNRGSVLKACRLVLHHRALEREYLETGEWTSAGAALTQPAEVHLLITHMLGHMLGDKLYAGVASGVLEKERIRALFHERIDGRGVALATYLELVELTASVEQTRGRADNL